MANTNKKSITLSKNRQVIMFSVLHNEHLMSCMARQLSRYTIDSYQSNYRLLSEFLRDEYNISLLNGKVE